MTLLALTVGEGADFHVAQLSRSSVLAFFYLVVAGSLLAFTAYSWLLRNAPISKVATYAYVNPVVAIFLGWWILHEKMTSSVLLGAAVIISSVAFIIRKESSPKPAQEAQRPDPSPDLVAADAGKL